MPHRSTSLRDRRGRFAILALTSACLLAFAVTLPMPRVDGQLVGSDGAHYFAYLPSLLIDGDLDFSDEYAYLYAYDPQVARAVVDKRTPTGLPANRLGVGPAILWSPFFAVAHLFVSILRAAGLDLAADGQGAVYQASVVAGSILYGCLGAWFCLLAARRLTTENAATAATLLTVLSGNLVYYLTIEPSMSHPLSVFASGAFCLAWLQYRERSACRDRFLIGGIAGVMALIRPHDGVFLLLPILDESLSALKRSKRTSGDGVRWLLSSLAMTAAAFAVFLPQLFAWKALNGSYFRSGYVDDVDTMFDWASPHLLEVLFSAQRGLFLWHPVFLLALAGLVVVARRERRLAALCLLGFVLQWVVVSSWRVWSQGDAFGGRMFIVCTPIFVLGAAALIERAVGRWSWRPVCLAGGLLVTLNLLLLVQYRLELLWLERPATLLDLTLGRFLIFL